MRDVRIAFIVVSVAAFSCEPAPPAIEAADYDQACSQNSTCVAVITGNVCDTCARTIDAVSEEALEEFTSDAALLQDACPPPRGVVDCEPAPIRIPECIDGTCTVPADAPLCLQTGEPPCRGVD